ncbi:MAG: hypothetical protein MI824_15115 [Hyphomicrobiales bacterium]|nr:hypothetical protein [Hyphomicrobiales bacterium]
MTPVQRRCLDAITGYIAEHGYSPSHEEIGAAIRHRSKCSVGRILRQLRDRGYIRYAPNRSRSIEVLDRPPVPTSVMYAAERLLDSVRSEDLEAGTAVVATDALGALDEAVAEARGRPTGAGAPMADRETRP